MKIKKLAALVFNPHVYFLNIFSLSRTETKFKLQKKYKYLSLSEVLYDKVFQSQFSMDNQFLK